MGMDSFDAAAAQPAPTGDGESVTDAMIQDLVDRREAGKKKYGTELKTNNGRDPLVDAYQEALDLSAYLRQEIMERGGGNGDEVKFRVERVRSWMFMLRDQVRDKWLVEDIVKELDEIARLVGAKEKSGE